MKLAEFAKHVLQSMRNCSDVDVGDVQDWAEKFGLLVEVPYDPEKHAELVADYDEYEPGDPLYTFSDELKAALEKENVEGD